MFLGCKLKRPFGFIIHCCCRLYFHTFDEIVTLTCTEKPILKILITSFSQYTTICFVSFVYSVFNEHFLEVRRVFTSVESELRACAYVSRVLQLSLKTFSLLNFTVLVPLRYSARSTKARGRSVRLCTSALSFTSIGRPKWTRTTDLVLIRHAL